MERIDVLREQVAILRALANSFDDQSIREQLLDLAAQCERLAKALEEYAQGAGPIVDEPTPDPS